MQNKIILPRQHAQIHFHLRKLIFMQKLWRTLEPLGFYQAGQYRIEHDLRIPSVRNRVWQTLRAHCVIYVHFAIECKT